MARIGLSGAHFINGPPPKTHLPPISPRDGGQIPLGAAELANIIEQLQAWQSTLASAESNAEADEPMDSAKSKNVETSSPAVMKPNSRKIMPEGLEVCLEAEESVSRRALKKSIGKKRKGQIPPFLATPILAIVLFYYGSDPYTLITARREYSKGVQHEFGDIMQHFSEINDIASFYNWFDYSLTAEESFDNYFRTGDAAAEFALFDTSNNTFNVLAITQTRDGCLNEDELLGSGRHPEVGVPISQQVAVVVVVIVVVVVEVEVVVVVVGWSWYCELQPLSPSLPSP